jgi:hypothetical protein
MNAKHRLNLAKIAIFGGVLGSVLPALAHHHVMKMERIASHSDIIFTGTVTTQAQWDWNGGKMQYTDVTFSDVKILFRKDSINLPDDGTIKLTLAGGELFKVTGVPEFETGSRYLVASHYDGNQYASPVVGGHQGSYKLATDESSGETHVLTHDGRSVVGMKNGVPVHADKPTVIRNGQGVYPQKEIDLGRKLDAPIPLHIGSGQPESRTRELPDRNAQPVMRLDDFISNLLIQQ